MKNRHFKQFSFLLSHIVYFRFWLSVLHHISVLDLGLISIGSLGHRASTKFESHVNFTESLTESQKVSQPNFFAILNTEKLAKTTN